MHKLDTQPYIMCLYCVHIYEQTRHKVQTTCKLEYKQVSDPVFLLYKLYTLGIPRLEEWTKKTRELLRKILNSCYFSKRKKYSFDPFGKYHCLFSFVISLV